MSEITEQRREKKKELCALCVRVMYILRFFYQRPQVKLIIWITEYVTFLCREYLFFQWISFTTNAKNLVQIFQSFNTSQCGKILEVTKIFVNWALNAKSMDDNFPYLLWFWVKNLSWFNVNLLKLRELGVKLKWNVIPWNAENCLRTWIFRDQKFTNLSLIWIIMNKLISRNFA